ncbi:MAG TPA: hypothetical protein VJL62_04290 [Thermodesulfobacteriota bacterium]|nr:hypothetical protein [Thermodesulfobacteriota bacterium]
MGFREDYDKLIELVATKDKADDILKAKEEFWKLTGKMYGDEPSFEMRISAFFDWYVFDKKINGATPLGTFLAEESEGYEGEKEIYQDFLNNIHSIFIVKSITSDAMKIRDLFTKSIYFLNGEDAPLGFYKNAVFEGRIFHYKDGLSLSPALCFHPKDSKRIINYILNMARKAGETNILPLIHRLSHMNLKWETYRNIKVKDIYKFEEYGERRFLWW